MYGMLLCWLFEAAGDRRLAAQDSALLVAVGFNMDAGGAPTRLGRTRSSRWPDAAAAQPL